jgi:hypothetical protein
MSVIPPDHPKLGLFVQFRRSAICGCITFFYQHGHILRACSPAHEEPASHG